MRAEVVAEGITFTAAENQLDLKYILSVMKAKLKSLFVFFTLCSKAYDGVVFVCVSIAIKCTLWHLCLEDVMLSIALPSKFSQARTPSISTLRVQYICSFSVGIALYSQAINIECTYRD